MVLSAPTKMIGIKWYKAINFNALGGSCDRVPSRCVSRPVVHVPCAVGVLTDGPQHSKSLGARHDCSKKKVVLRRGMILLGHAAVT